MPDSGGGWGYAFSKVCFSDGTEVQVSADAAVLIVGPNNAGKSAALRELISHLQPVHQEQPPPKVVLDIEVELRGSESDLQRWLNDHSFHRETNQGLIYKRPGAE